MLHPSLRRSPHRSTGAIVCAACLLLAVVSQPLAAEPLELRNREQQPRPSGPTMPAQPIQPGQPGPGVIIVPSPQSPQIIVPIVPPEPSAPQVVTPEVREPQTVTPPVVIVPAVPPQPVQPETRPAPAPEQPQPPVVTPPGTVVIVPPTPEDKTPEKKDEKLLTPESFLLTTPEPEKKPQIKPEEKRQAEKKPEKKPEVAKQEPLKQPEEKKPEEKKPEKTGPPKKGDPLQIPEEAIKTGQLDFLEGCWVGTRPEYHTKRIITERFCFGKDGTGKRFISDPAYAGECVGATKAVLNQGGVLHMQSEKMYCSNTPENWGASEMTCQGEGNQTPCSWVFHDAGGGRQSYTIRFVRE